MGRKRYWKGFISGLAVGGGASLASWLAARTVRGRQHEKIVRLEKSVQIGRPVQEVFRAWSNFEQLPSLLRMIEDVQVRGNLSHWVLRINGRRVAWEAELTQQVENRALGWKSRSGPKHTGRIDFSPIADDTLVHVVMNYAPPLGSFGRNLAEQSGLVEAQIEQALRDFKAALEGKGQERGAEERGPARRIPGDVLAGQQGRATGTYGSGELSGHTQTSRFGGEPNPVEYTRSPVSKP